MTIELDRRTALALGLGAGASVLLGDAALAQAKDSVTIGWPSDVPSWDPKLTAMIGKCNTPVLSMERSRITPVVVSSVPPITRFTISSLFERESPSAHFRTEGESSLHFFRAMK